MSDILERLDKLKTRIQDEGFLKGEGLSNEVNFNVFCYEPEDEMAVRFFTEQIVSDQELKCHVKEINLYKIFLKLCEDSRLIDRLPGIEKKKGPEFILRNLQSGTASARNFVNEIFKEGFSEGDVLMITGVGEAFPFIRSHDILNNMRSQDIGSVPIVVLYPGIFVDSTVQLFGRLPKIGYYRAFNIIGKGEKL